ncbi:MAG: hypothetical protein JSR86_13325 [Proteobacteria bacterium]|nr:hypothetical protein [Pseudomonadota bacterium]
MDSKTPARRAKSKALTAANLEALGAARLAQILIEAADEQPAVKRRARLALAASVGADALVQEIEKPVEALAAAHGRIPWRRVKALRQDLDLLRASIAGPLAEADPRAAVTLMLRFVGLERGLLARAKDAKGEVAQIFAEALADLAALAAAAGSTPPGIVPLAMAVLADLRLATMGPAAEALAPALDALAIAELRARIETETAGHRRIHAGWRAALQALLDAQGDAAAYAATWSTSEAVLPPIGARIAARFLAAGLTDEAGRALALSDPFADGQRPKTPDPGLAAWEAVSIDFLEAGGETEAAQAARWAAFLRHLTPDLLRSYLRGLSGFDDVEATERALEHALALPQIMPALAFLVAWPALKEAAALVEARSDELDGEAVDILEPAARALEGRYPLAGALVLRALIFSAARSGQADRVKRAKTWMLEAASLSHQIADFAGHLDHEAFEAAVRRYATRF